MGKKKNSTDFSKKSQPAMTPEARENQLISLAYDRAEQRLRDGTATSQEIVHFLKLGSTKERIEMEILERQKDMIQAKTESLQSAKRTEELFNDALNAFKVYSGNGDKVDEDLY